MVKQIGLNHLEMMSLNAPTTRIDAELAAAAAATATIARPPPSIGRAVSCALLRAVYEKRVVVGVAAAVKELLSNSTAPGATDAGDVVFCVLAPAAEGDSAMHMNTILLEAFCYENGIYTVKVDNARKLTRLLNAPRTQTCALIQRPWAESEDSAEEQSQQQQQQFEESQLTVAEQTMVDHCEEFWDMQQPIVHLPD